MAHLPVMSYAVNSYLSCPKEGVIIDGTLGCGGHSEAILSAYPAEVSVLGIDRDKDALDIAMSRLGRFGKRFQAVHGSYGDLTLVEELVRGQRVIGFLLDLGLSSLQLDSPGRGFSFNDSESMDMRFDPSDGTETALNIINTASETNLANIFFNFGEETRSRRIAKAIVNQRSTSLFKNGKELGDCISRAVGFKRIRQGNRRLTGRQRGLHPATQVFQALRIATNRELEHLEAGLNLAAAILVPRGRLVVISYHSLEDRIVKQFFVNNSGKCKCPPDFPECRCNPSRIFKIITRKPVLPEEKEMQANPRSRSAKLRCAEKVEDAA